MKQPTQILVAIVIAQFLGTSLWFAGNAALPQLVQHYTWAAGSLGYVTSAVQLGFIVGTFCFALSGITDRFNPSHVFLISCVAGASLNLLALVDLSSFGWVLTSRLCVGVSLAGIYPVGMKLAADWQDRGLGHWLGALVGALVLGTSLPHLLKTLPALENIKALLMAVSAMAVLGGLVVLVFVPAGPYRSRGSKFSFQLVVQAFQSSAFRKPAFGYFGHMWELYTFWAFVPFILNGYSYYHPDTTLHPVWSFVIVAAGAFGCWAGGWWSKKTGSEKVALYALSVSLACCLLTPFIWLLPKALFLIFLLVWSVAVIADSPQFSALVARHASPHVRGSALTMVTCIGFSITIVSIQLLSELSQRVTSFNSLFLLLAIGPAIGVYALQKKSSTTAGEKQR